MIKYAVIIPARNEKERIKKTILSLKSQSFSPSIIIVIDDFSNDGTGEIAKSLGARVLRVERKSNKTLTGTPYMAYLFNRGFKEIENAEYDYIAISGADCIYPKEYFEKLINQTMRDNAVISSGVAQGESSSELSVRGAGRIIQTRWFKSIGFRYPLNYGFESWPVLKALKDNFIVKVYPEIVFKLSRKTEVSIRKAYLWGKGMRALGYWSIYAIGRCLLTMLKSPRAGIKMMAGYLSYVEKYKDLEDFVANFQKRKLYEKIISMLKLVWRK
ncbi:MAG: glycosyltransferase family A protein [Candidatus Aenigmatarchaeota archaeon]